MRAAALAAVIGLLACTMGEAAPRKPATIKVAIEEMKFSPAEVAVKPGDTIVWTNNDVVAHTVTSTAGTFDSNIIPPGATWKYVVRKVGAFGYKCSYHPTMTAELTVR
jgi:plastocyanin